MVSVDRVFKLRDHLLNELVGYCGCPLEGAAFDTFVNSLSAELPHNLPHAAVYQSARIVMGKVLDHNDLRAFAWRLAGNLDVLRKNEPVIPWTFQPEPELMPVQVLDHEYAQTAKHKPAARYRLRVLAGRACPMIIHKSWAKDFVRYLASHVMGFSKPWGDFPFKDTAELVRLRFLVMIDPEFCRDEQPGFDQVAESSSCRAWNRDIMKQRARVSAPCPQDFKHPCHKCPVGYDKCPAGTHPRTYVVQTCATCGCEAPHDAARQGAPCLSCARKSAVP